jgi:hypothetical protein
LIGDYIMMTMDRCAESYMNGSARSVTLGSGAESAAMKCAESDARRAQVGRVTFGIIIVLN